MDTHTLVLLEFQKIRLLVASRAACSLGKEAAMRLEPLFDQAEIQNRLALCTEMVEAIRSGLSPSLGGLHDIRLQVRPAQGLCSSRRNWRRQPRRCDPSSFSTAG
jgi:DNA mismatch repair protein MutS2